MPTEMLMAIYIRQMRRAMKVKHIQNASGRKNWRSRPYITWEDEIKWMIRIDCTKQCVREEEK